MKIDQKRVPEALTHLIPLAEKWGIGDDFEREEQLSDASPSDLQVLVDAIQALPDEGLNEWLGGPESHSVAPTPEYLAFTCMTMAYDSARVKLKKRINTEQPLSPR